MDSQRDPTASPDAKTPISADPPKSECVPPTGPGAAPPVITGSRRGPDAKSAPFRQMLAVLLSLCLALYFADGILSLANDSLLLFGGFHLLTTASNVLSFSGLFLTLLIYGLTGFSPIVPKRVFLPLITFNLLGFAIVCPILIYHFDRMVQVDWVMSLLETTLVLVIVCWLQGGWRLSWPIVEVRHLGRRWFSWMNLAVFLLLNVFVLLPVSVAYFALCAGLAASHYTDGFMKLRPYGTILEARKYVRADGKTIVLFPMSHIADAGFYRAVSQSASSNAIVLLEGVTDEKNLLTNELSYRRAAKSLGLAEQHDDLDISQGTLIRADLDVQDFSSNTVAVLNLVALVHSKGLDAATLSQLIAYSSPAGLEQQLFTDLLIKRNDHLLHELDARLPQSDTFIIPWGAMHMPGIAREIQNRGFRLVETHDYVSIRFRWKKTNHNQGTNNPDWKNPR